MKFSESIPRWGKVLVIACSISVSGLYISCQHHNAQPLPSSNPKNGTSPSMTSVPPASSTDKPRVMVLGTKSIDGLLASPRAQQTPPPPTAQQQSPVDQLLQIQQ